MDETVDETVDETQFSVKVSTNKSIAKSLKLKDGESQTAVVATRSVEVEANLSTEELKQMKEKLALKAQECELISEKFLEKVNAIEQLNADMNALKSGN